MSTPPLDPCGCCEGVTALTPAALDNRPGLSALAYRVGTHGTFKQTMQSALAGQQALDRLTARDDADPSIALIDACATMLDVLTFYQERIANEGFLRTATERRSILELARKVGYELNPGVAASTYLAFTLEDAPGSPGTATIEVGTKVQSLPGPGELPQTFETIAPLTAYTAWNKIQPRLTQPQQLTIVKGVLYLIAGDNKQIPAQRLYISGTQTNLKAGDLLLVTVGSDALPVAIKAVEVETDQTRTRLDLDVPAPVKAEPLPAISPTLTYDPPVNTGGTPDFKPLPLTEANIKTNVLQRRWRERDLATFLAANRWSADELLDYVKNLTAVTASNVLAFRTRAGFFGHNAPLYDSLPKPSQKTSGIAALSQAAESLASVIDKGIADKAQAQKDPVITITFIDPDWDSGSGRSIWTTSKSDSDYYTKSDKFDVYLERSLPDVVRNSWAIFASTKIGPTPYRIAEVAEVSLADYGMSGRTTGLALRKPSGAVLLNTTTDKPQDFRVRKTTAYVQSETLPLEPLPIEEPVGKGATALLLDTMVLGLSAGQTVIVSGEQADAPGVLRSEVLVLKEIIHYQGYTTLIFTTGLQWSYLRETLTINANVALSTHGETKKEVLGSGDAAQPLQKFVLKQSPLTYVSAATTTGSASTLEVRVNDIAWDEVAALYGLAPRDRAYITRTDDAAKTTVQFGDGISGARLPSGTENITATYRVGTGLAGMVKAGQLSLLMTRPLGVKGVTNPLAPSGAEDPETRDKARENAPLTVLTLGRIVSLQDFEDFARAFAGIGKAQATWLWSGEHRLIYLTVAAADGGAVASTLFTNLKDAIDLARDPIQQVTIASYTPIAFNLEAKVLIERGYLADKVKAAVTDALQQTFSFDQRGFGQAVTKSEVLATIQAVEGVEAADLDKLYLVGQAQKLNERLPARTATWDPTALQPTPKPAELLTLSRDGVALTEMKR
ncbi:MAG TPA: putative baseplate assembly protein [Herpetosiphonaceae bacterium]